jgi:translation initiation factor IF-3
VQVVNEEGNLDEPQKLLDVLASFDRNKFFCIQVAAAAGPSKPPICKILNKKEYRESEKAKIKAAKSAAQSTKQVELNWAIDAHDLQHRLKQLATFLDKGRKVEVILTRKKHKRSATVDEIKNVMQSVMDTIREAGGTQIKPMEGEPGKHVILTVTKEK